MRWMGKGFKKKSDFDFDFEDGGPENAMERHAFCRQDSHLTGSAAGASKLFNIVARRMSADFAAHRGPQKAGEVCEDFFQ